MNPVRVDMPLVRQFASKRPWNKMLLAVPSRGRVQQNLPHSIETPQVASLRSPNPNKGAYTSGRTCSVSALRSMKAPGEGNPSYHNARPYQVGFQVLPKPSLLSG